ncbi:hypothetical protein BABINDRAFT_160716 [Babjeviella inositovora NRRL Y-12698]|uniref:Arrestin-like N-terminal domain-containing protein n=1 Tax=Babjeviella inositovora NRRL Y-12698 TaxID=984486 RepID=A0A1E3QUX1_9ASCO|nr:uncharacterized protein BABINDRAFT_160716 [Babjeviella inositovora NRRL Y-12698]ODQ81364.1 hypothetical protein BABINDRAFT_160716 [Babjeviella inositovora NRRL Y-12698]
MGVDIQISLNKSHYTSEPINGKVLIHNSSELTLDYVEVKLEGVARSSIRVRGKRRRRQRRALQLDRIPNEEHKVLYQTVIVFPPPEIRKVASPNTQFTLPPGKHNFEFLFQIPVDNSSEQQHTKYPSSDGHLKCPLPPTMDTVKLDRSRHQRGEAEVKYYAKVVAKRKDLMKLSSRKKFGFTFFPVDVARDPHLTQLVVSQNHIFHEKFPVYVPTHGSDQDIKQEETYELLGAPKTSISDSFSSKKRSSRKETAQQYAAHARDIPIQLQVRFRELPGVRAGTANNFSLYLITKLPPQAFQLGNGNSSGLGQFYLNKIDIVLAGLTAIKTGALRHEGCTNWSLGAYEGLHRIDLANAQPSLLDPSMFEIEIPKALFGTPKRAFAGLVPSFQVCNIERSYTINVVANFKYTADEKGKLLGLLSRNKVELNAGVQVWSGINAGEEASDQGLDLLSPEYVQVGIPSGFPDEKNMEVDSDDSPDHDWDDEANYSTQYPRNVPGDEDSSLSDMDPVYGTAESAVRGQLPPPNYAFSGGRTV